MDKLLLTFDGNVHYIYVLAVFYFEQFDRYVNCFNILCIVCSDKKTQHLEKKPNVNIIFVYMIFVSAKKRTGVEERKRFDSELSPKD